ncbi:MAG: glycosyltransferase [Arthrospira sp. SH-MAG29]|nr:glycosyltransferase [Arthrospira sp. SH-MAG29]MBS0016475.1 glycosyltransferase [Arthrospira sp. SH-MAG29]
MKTCEYYLDQGNSHYKHQQWSEAIAHYQRALELNPNLPGIHQKLADALYQQAQADRSHLLSHYQNQIQQNPNDLTNYYKALEIYPDHVEIYLGLAKALAKKGYFDRAQLAYQKVQQLQPDHPQLQLLQSPEDTIFQANLISSPLTPKLDPAKQVLDTLNQITLDNFINSNSRLNFPVIEQPEISIILILYNRAELTLSCLYSLIRNPFQSFELILIDNHSTDATPQLLQQIDGAKIVRNDRNLHYLLACNQASQIATGKYLLFLNNDAQILGNSIPAAIDTIESSEDIGAVGGKLILPDGTLQEAGSIIWQDGTCLGYGRGDSPNAPQYQFSRPVDYCSAAFFLTLRQLFLDLGGFDEDFRPAYYEETDYCVRLWKSGKKVIYNPNVTVIHYEFGSSSNSGHSPEAIALMETNQKILAKKHAEWFPNQYPADLKNLTLARTRSTNKRILYIDDRIPHPWLGSGYTRSHQILTTAINLGYDITLYPTDLRKTEDWKTTYLDIPRTVEVLANYGWVMLSDLLVERPQNYDIIFISRPHNLSKFNTIISEENIKLTAKIIYDAEAIFCLRDIQKRQHLGEILTDEQIKTECDREIKLAQTAHHIIAVSPQEQQKFIDYGYSNVSILSHSIPATPTPNDFGDRQDILFVGAIHEIDSPNADSVLWLCREIFPKIQNQLNQPIQLLIAGNWSIPEFEQQLKQLANPNIKILGKVENLTALYNQTRIFVAPTRFAAGIPHKVHEAAAYGLPIITTSLIASQLGWQDEKDLLVADTTEAFIEQILRLYQDVKLWQTVKDNAMQKIEVECSPKLMSEMLKFIFKS